MNKKTLNVFQPRNTLVGPRRDNSTGAYSRRVKAEIVAKEPLRGQILGMFIFLW